jgi:membrane protein involved in colicin uptake
MGFITSGKTPRKTGNAMTDAIASNFVRMVGTPAKRKRDEVAAERAAADKAAADKADANAQLGQAAVNNAARASAAGLAADAVSSTPESPDIRLGGTGAQAGPQATTMRRRRVWAPANSGVNI